MIVEKIYICESSGKPVLVPLGQYDILVAKRSIPKIFELSLREKENLSLYLFRHPELVAYKDNEKTLISLFAIIPYILKQYVRRK